MRIKELIDIKTLQVKWDKIYQIEEFDKLRYTHQNLVWHKEDFVSIHTCNVVNEIQSNISSDEKEHKLILLAAALFHDIGKGSTTVFDEEEKTYKSPNHAIEGEKITRKLLWDEDFKLREKICTLVRNHMKPLYISEDNEVNEIIKLSLENVNLCDLLALKRADCGGSIQTKYDGWMEKLNHIEEVSKKLNCYNRPYIFNSEAERAFFIKNGRLPEEGEEVPPIDFIVYVMIGLPGSGKSTTIRKSYLNRFPIVSRDDIRVSIGIPKKKNGSKKQEKEVTKLFDEKLINLANLKQSFVIDNMNLYKMWRNDYKNKLKDYNVWYSYVYVQSPSFEENLNRRHGLISENVMNRMLNEFEFPRATEYCQLLNCIQSNNVFTRLWTKIKKDYNILKELLPS